MKPSQYLVRWIDCEKEDLGVSFVYAENPQQAADLVRGTDPHTEILAVAKVCKNWK